MRFRDRIRTHLMKQLQASFCWEQACFCSHCLLALRHAVQTNSQLRSCSQPTPGEHVWLAPRGCPGWMQQQLDGHRKDFMPSQQCNANQNGREGGHQVFLFDSVILESVTSRHQRNAWNETQLGSKTCKAHSAPFRSSKNMRSYLGITPRNRRCSMTWLELLNR